MSCTNPNCNPGCGCNNCCPPVPPPVPPTPPMCEGTDCVELYDAACVKYTGPAIPCMNIASGVSINSIIQTLAANICECCNKSTCVNPLKLFFERVKFTFDVLFAQNPDILFVDLFKDFLLNGMSFKKCQYCCPDSVIYSLNFNNFTCNEVTEYLAGKGFDAPCVNCWDNFNNCATELLASFDTTLNDELNPGLTLDDVCEYGGFNNVSGICEINSILQELFTYDQITGIISSIYQNGFWVLCDTPNGNIVIGSPDNVKKYIQNYIPFR